MTPAQMYELVLLALCCWREARGEGSIAKLGQAWSVRNRVMNPGWWGRTWPGVVLCPKQYSSFNGGDPNAIKLPFNDDPAWQECLAIAAKVYACDVADPTDGATHYFDASLDAHPPAWALDPSMKHVTDLGRLRFYKKA